MKSLLPCLLCVVQLLLHPLLYSQNKKLHIDKEPSWITVNKLDYTNTSLDGDAEDGYFDLAYEKQVSLLTEERYYKKAVKILSAAGVENASEVSVNFDPSYEQLTFHNVKILRDGKLLNKLELSKFKTIQQEKDLDMHMYDGSLTSFLLLDDVRKGDVIEYSYTLKGFNPIFKGKYADTYDCQFSVPIGNLYYKLIVPAAMHISLKNNNTKTTPFVDRQPDKTTFEWKQVNVAALHLETKTPGWYDPYASVSVSEYSNWKEVSDWAVELFPRNPSLSPGLNKKINEIRTSCATDEERILAALHFVQDDIRYMGIEMGTGSHKPSAPDKIFAQRFGDCKDKSYLMCCMLNAMNIDASPILINTVAKRMLNDRLPAANIFDHVTVQVKSGGKVRYFDPTISLQRGPIDNIAYPNYQTGLVINEATTALINIPFFEPGRVEIKEIFTIPDMSGTASLKVITKNTGSFADNTRGDFNYNSVYEMKNKYKDFYAAFFEKITADSLTIKDDEKTGTFTTTEYYSLKNVWKTEDGIQKSAFEPFVINSIMSKPADQNRTMPFYLTYPAKYKEQLEINLPDDWSVKDFEQKIESPCFMLSAEGSCSGNKVFLNYEYENLKDHVAPDNAANFFASYKNAVEATGYSLTYNHNKTTNAFSTTVAESSSSNSLGTFPKLYIILGLSVMLTFLVRRQRQKQY